MMTSFATFILSSMASIEMGDVPFIVVDRPPDQGERGVIYLLCGSEDIYGEYIYIDGRYECLGEVAVSEDPKEKIIEEPKGKKVRCDVCGVVLHNGRCEYCGAEYF